MTPIHIIYRASPARSIKVRPPWFSKALCLASLLRSAFFAEDVHFVFVVDGIIPEVALGAMLQYGPVSTLHDAGNSGSYRLALREALRAMQSDWVFLCEDDYLFTLQALPSLQAAAGVVGRAVYLTPYDHPDRYLSHHDWRVRGGRDVVVAGRRWRSVESTTMTYATCARTLAYDAWVHRVFTSRGTPVDRQLWLFLQGAGCLYLPSRMAGLRRNLLGPVPSLATHCEAPYLAPGVDWAAEAAAVGDWIEQEVPSLGRSGW